MSDLPMTMSTALIWRTTAFPEWFMDKWPDTITVDEEGTILSSQWEDENEHPDLLGFHITTQKQEVNGSKLYLVYGDILDHLVLLER